MRVLLTCLLLGLAAPALAEDAQMQSTITRQLEALQRDDYPAAFDFASPNIKGIFGSPENFGRMVREGYPMVHRPSAVKMLEARDVDGALWQRVLITDAEGRSHLLDYQMVETAEGWQINAVQLLKATGTGA